MKFLVVDIETSDPWIREDRGSGWPEKAVEFLCAVTYDVEGGYKTWTSTEALKSYMTGFDTMVAHNAAYELGVLYSYGIPVENYRWICTRILAILYRNNLMSFSLDALAKHYLGDCKNDNETLGALGIELGLVKPHIKLSGKAVKSRFMKEVYTARPETVQEYCKQDVVLTVGLYRHFQAHLEPTLETLDFYSDLQKAFMRSRAIGLRIEVKTMMDILGVLEASLKPLEEKLSEYKIGGSPLNPNSPKQLAEFFKQEKIDLAVTETGNPSTSLESLTQIDHPLAQTIVEYRGITKILNTYILPYLSLVKPDEKYITVYPEIIIFGANRTGRCASKNPNIQNIPTRKALGNAIRGMFVPREGKKFVSLDYSGQELRLMVDLAARLKLQGIQDIIKEFHKDPDFDIHRVGAEILNVDRNKAKAFVLGIPYGLWYKTMAERLNIGDAEAKKLYDGISDTFPFLGMLFKVAREVATARGYVKDISGRAIYLDTGFEKNGHNAVIQGSAAYQLNKAVVEAYRQGIIIAAPIHDEIIAEVESEEDAQKIKTIMEGALKLAIPSVVHYALGNTWGELK